MSIIGVLGLGKLGLPLALVFAQAGHRVLVWDTDEQARTAVQNRQPHITEPLVEELLRQYQLEIVPPGFMVEVAEAVFLVVPTPSKDNGHFSDEFVASAIHSLAKHRGTGPPLACVSTLSPGSTRRMAELAGEHGLPLLYTPTMIALGTVVHDLQHGHLQLIGTDDAGRPATIEITRLWRTVAPEMPQQVMSYESAEIAKLAQNVFSTLKVAFANQVGQLCDRIPGADVDDIVEALGLQPHIGRPLLTAGAGFGGPCWPRDTRAWSAEGELLGEVINELNDGHVRYVCGQAVGLFTGVLGSGGLKRRAKTFAVLGRAYKEGTNYRIESFGDRVHNHLRQLYRLKPVHAREAEIVVLALPLKGVNLCSEVKPGALVLDLWRTHGYLADCPVTYVPFGAPNRSTAPQTTGEDPQP